MFISSDMRGDISLLNIYCGAAMIEVIIIIIIIIIITV